MTYLVIYEDRHGRVLHGLCRDPGKLLDQLVHSGFMAKAKRKEATVYLAVPSGRTWA